MSLLHLPPELLRQIFDEVGPSFFHEDLGRLTVCKWWRDFALPICFKCITVVPNSLHTLVASEAAKTPSDIKLKDSLEDLTIHLRGQLNYGSTVDPEYPPGVAGTQETVSAENADSSITVLNYDLSKLANICQQSRKLRALRIRARRLIPSHADIFSASVGHLLPTTMKTFLSLRNLEHLVLDSYVDFMNPSVNQRQDEHLCSVIRNLLPTLRVLHLRMRNICPDVLKPQDSDDRLRLEVVIVNLSLLTYERVTTAAMHSKQCGSRPVGGPLLLKSAMEKQADALVARMASPRIVRILSHTVPSFEMQSFDVLTGKTMVLEEGMSWDEDGKTVVEESESEAESEISSLSDF